MRVYVYRTSYEQLILILIFCHLKVDLHGWSHSTFNVHLSNILPLLLEKRSQKVGSKLNIDNDTLFLHTNITDGNVEAHNLLHLKLNG
mmetsp:Transcript_5568/g.8084  ORF Transcript_5568/g.8084 Transcript_5568/m.8084 type:complete len:88 (+) Transcript_5568:1-264(+)